jgi:hypothetical protein
MYFYDFPSKTFDFCSSTLFLEPFWTFLNLSFWVRGHYKQRMLSGFGTYGAVRQRKHARHTERHFHTQIPKNFAARLNKIQSTWAAFVRYFQNFHCAAEQIQSTWATFVHQFKNSSAEQIQSICFELLLFSKSEDFRCAAEQIQPIWIALFANSDN